MRIKNIVKRIGAFLLTLSIVLMSVPNTSEVTTVADEASDLAMQYALVWDYYSNACFLGDSLMVGFRNYSEKYDTACAKTSNFLAAKSFASYYALRPEKNAKKQPEYQGQKLAVWDSISKMKADKVFIYLGTNDLVGISPEKTTENLMALCANIKNKNPEVSIHIIGMAPVYAGTNKGYLNNKDVDKYNALVKQQAELLGYGFVDLNPYLKDTSGNLKAEYSSDKYVHMTYEAYAIWNQVLFEYAINQIASTLLVEQ